MDEIQQPKLPKAVVDVWQYMMDHHDTALPETIFNNKNPEHLIVWRGFGYEIAKAVHYNKNVVYRSISILETLGSIRRIKHGAGPAPSVYQLLKEPEGKEYLAMKERSLISDRLQVPTQAQRIQDTLTRFTNRLNDIERRLRDLENGR